MRRCGEFRNWPSKYMCRISSPPNTGKGWNVRRTLARFIRACIQTYRCPSSLLGDERSRSHFERRAQRVDATPSIPIPRRSPRVYPGRSSSRAQGFDFGEIARHGGRGAYRATQADRRAWRRARRRKRCLLAVNRRLCEAVTSKLMLEWSPEQISGWRRRNLKNS